jgi:hypothetical protein
MSRVRQPALAAYFAEVLPEGPAPTTRTSNDSTAADPEAF